MRRAALLGLLLVGLAGSASAGPREDCRNKFGPEAMTACNEAIRLSPRDADLYDLRGGIYSTRGDREIGIKDFDRAIELDPRHHSAYRGRGFAHLGLKNFDRAIADYTKALEVDPARAGSHHYWRAQAYEGKGDIKAAIADFRRAYALAPAGSLGQNSRDLATDGLKRLGAN